MKEISSSPPRTARTTSARRAGAADDGRRVATMMARRPVPSSAVHGRDCRAPTGLSAGGLALCRSRRFLVVLFVVCGDGKISAELLWRPPRGVSKITHLSIGDIKVLHRTAFTVQSHMGQVSRSHTHQRGDVT